MEFIKETCNSVFNKNNILKRVKNALKLEPICNEQLTHDLCLQVYVRLPSKYEPFINSTEWISDKCFTQQRLAAPINQTGDIS